MSLYDRMIELIIKMIMYMNLKLSYLTTIKN